MIRIRKRGESWEARYQGNNGNSWRIYENLEDLQQTIIDTAVNLDHYVKITLEILNGQSETYLYQDGELIRRKPLGKVFCLTPFLQQRANLETLIYMIESGKWRVRDWKTPACLAHFPEDTWLPEKKVKRCYQILETNADEFMPSDFECIDVELIKSRV